MDSVFYVATGIFGYGLGSIPFGLWLARLGGVADLTHDGSGGMGATNVLRLVGPLLGLSVLLGDAGKGVLAVWGALLLAQHTALPATDFLSIAALSAVLGHIFCPWLGLRGGKGVATGLGAVLVLSWPGGLVMLAVWVLVFAAKRISSLASLVCWGVSPLVFFVLANLWDGSRPGLPRLMIVLTILILWTHRENISRLRRGQEARLDFAAKRKN